MANAYNPYQAQTGIPLTLPICDKVITQDISGDFSLPDYQPEIKRLLRITAEERRVLFYALNDLRNTLLEEGKGIELVNGLMLKLVD